jgi:hypothetical protein
LNSGASDGLPMNDSPEKGQRQALVAALQRIALDHHQAFAALDGQDPEWPSWYAERLQPQVEAILGRPVSKSDLIFLMLDAERQRPNGSDWADLYARRIMRG